MRWQGLRRGAGAVLLALGWLCAAPALAQEGPSQPAPAEGETPEYHRLVDAALEEYARANWIEAYALFLKAHELWPNARTLRGLAVCAFESKKYLRAIELMRAALADTRKALDDSQRAAATALIERAYVFVGRLTLTVEPAEARLEVDAAPATRDANGRVLLDPGTRQLTLTLPGYLTETRSLSVSPGDDLQLTVQLAPVPATVHVATAPELAQARPELPRVHDEGTTRTWAWVGAAGAVAFAGAGGALFVIGRDGVQEIEESCPPAACTKAEIRRQIDRRGLRTLQTGSIVSLALAGASAVVSTVLFATSRDEPSQGLLLRASF